LCVRGIALSGPGNLIYRPISSTFLCFRVTSTPMYYVQYCAMLATFGSEERKWTDATF